MPKPLPRLSLDAYDRIVDTELMQAITIPECCEMFGVNYSTVRNAMITNALPAREIKIIGHINSLWLVHRPTAAKLWGKQNKENDNDRAKLGNSGQSRLFDVSERGTK